MTNKSTLSPHQHQDLFNAHLSGIDLNQRLDSLYDELDRYVLITDYDSDLDDLTREIAELRYALSPQ